MLAQREPGRERRVVTSATREEVTNPVGDVAFVGRGERGRETETTFVAHASWFPSPRTRKPRVARAHRGYLIVMIILGIILLILGLILSVPVLWVIGLVLVAVGAILWVAGAAGHEVAGRRHYY